MVKKTHLRVDETDLKKLMTVGVKLFLEENPDFEGTNITQSLMFKRAVRLYCKL